MLEKRIELSNDNIRGQMNLVYTMMRFIATLLSMAKDSPLARETISVTAEGLFEQCAILYRDISQYVELTSETEEERVSAS